MYGVDGQLIMKGSARGWPPCEESIDQTNKIISGTYIYIYDDDSCVDISSLFVLRETSLIRQIIEFQSFHIYVN